MNKKETFLENFGLGRVVHGIESDDEDDYLPINVGLKDNPSCPVVINTPQRSKVTARRRLHSSGGSGITPLRVSRLGLGGWQVARKSVSPTTGYSPPITPIKVMKKSPGSWKASRNPSRDVLTEHSPPVTPLNVTKKPSGKWKASRKVASSSDNSPPVTPLQFTKKLSGTWKVSRRSSSTFEIPEPNISPKYELQPYEDEVFNREVPSYDLSWMPKIVSVFSEGTGETCSFKLMDSDENITEYDVHSTCVPIEECPRCCTELVPMQFTVNVDTAVMKTMCHCGLNIEIGPKSTICTTNTVSQKRKRNESNINLKHHRL